MISPRAANGQVQAGRNDSPWIFNQFKPAILSRKGVDDLRGAVVRLAVHDDDLQQIMRIVLRQHGAEHLLDEDSLLPDGENDRYRRLGVQGSRGQS